MKYFLIIFILFFTFQTQAQDQPYGNLTVFSDKGDLFFLYLDGKKINDAPQSKVRAEKLDKLSYNVQVVYNDASRFTVSKNNVYISDGDDNLMDVAYRVSRTGSTARIRFYSMNTARENADPYATIGKQPVTLSDEGTPSGTLNVFSEQGDPFFLYLNGEKQNETAQTNIRIEHLTNLYYNVKIIFKDSKLNAITKNNVYVSDGDDVMMDARYKLSRTSWYAKLKFYSMNPVNPGFTAPAGMYVRRHGDAPGSNTIASVPATTIVKETKVPVVLPVKDTAITISAKPALPQKSIVKNKPVKEKVSQPVVEKKITPAVKENNIAVKEPANWVCQNEWPMWKADYALAKKDIAEAKTEDLKLSAANKLVSNNCLNSDQVMEIGTLLMLDESKLVFAKSAFSHTIDIKNYHKVAGIFLSAKGREAFKKFLSQ